MSSLFTLPLRKMFGFHATEDKGRRKSPARRTMSENRALSKGKRKKLSATGQDQMRNHSVLTWAVRRHLDYVATFDPFVDTGCEEIDIELQQLLDWHGRKANFDVSRRHNRRRMLRILEANSVVDGDSAWLKVKGGRIRGIEGSQLCMPADGVTQYVDKLNEHGQLISPTTGEALKWTLCKYDENGTRLIFDTFLDGADLIERGYYLNRFAQTRGVSPIRTALNTMADLAEGWEYLLLKIKMHALLGVAIYRDLEDDLEDETDDDGEGSDSSSDALEFSDSGPSFMQLNDGEKAQLLESNTPPSQVIEWSTMQIHVVLASLDIPLSAWDSTKSSFSARIADRNEYETSANDKRNDNREVLDEYTDWIVPVWCVSPEPRFEKLNALRKKHNVSIMQIIDGVTWVPTGTPWLDKLDEVNGDIRAIAAGLDSIPMVCRRRGLDWRQIEKQNRKVGEKYKDHPIPLMLGESGARSAAEVKAKEKEKRE